MIVNNIEITELTDTDIPFVAALERDFFATPWSIQDLQKHMEEYPHTFFTAKNGKQTCGYIGFSPSFETADIITLGVADKHRRQGIAEKLLRFILHKCKDMQVSKVFLEVRESNFPALSLYRKLGFQEISVRKNYYSCPTENAIVMVKELER